VTDAARIADILERIDRIERATEGGETAFRESEIIQDAVIRNLEVVGEATKHISATTRQRYPKIPWREMARFRDLAIHPYGRVLVDEVWEIVVRDLRPIRRALAHAKAPVSG
jgi:uncharacterized protein with HEPN domain